MQHTLAIKSETDSTLTLEGWGVVYGGEDLSGEYFSADTNFWLTELGPVKMALYDHGQNDAVKSAVLGSGTLEEKTAADGTAGLWFTAELNKSQAYVKQVAKLAKAGVLGASSGAVSHLVERVEQDTKTWIKSWPIAEISLLVTPCEPRTLGFESLKALIAQGEAVKASIAAAPSKPAAIKATSYEQIRDQIYRVINRADASPFDLNDPDWSCIVGTFPDHVIVERIDYDADGDGGLFKIAYTIDAAGQVTLGDVQQVTTEYPAITKSLVGHAEALKALLPKEAPSKGASQQSTSTQPTAEVKTSVRITTPAQETSMTPEEMSALTDSVSAKFAPQFDAISKVLERFETEPALKSAGVVSQDGGAADKNVKSFADYLVAIKRNDVKRLTTVYEAKAALAEDDGTTGGFLIPTEYRRDLLQVAAEQAIVRPRAFVLPMGARELEIPSLDQTAAATSGQSAFLGGAVFKWAAEAAAYDETEPKFKMIRLVAHKLEGYTLSSNEMLADSAIALEAFLRRLFGQALAWHEDYAFLQGNGVGKPLGVLNAPAAVAVTRNTASSFKIQDIGAMLAALPAASFGNAVWLMNQSVIPQLIQLSLSNATIVSFVSNLREKMPATLMGLPIAFTEKLPVLGTKGDVLLCDFSAYLVGDRQQVTIASSEHYKFINGQMTWRVDERVDGQPWLKAAIALQDGTTTVSPFVILN